MKSPTFLKNILLPLLGLACCFIIWQIISDSAQAFPRDADLRRAAAAIDRVDARELILGVLTSVAIADTVSPGEMGLLDALRAAWGIVDRADDSSTEDGGE